MTGLVKKMAIGAEHLACALYCVVRFKKEFTYMDIEVGSLFGGAGLVLGLFYLIVIVLWIAVPIFIYLINKRVKEMRDNSREYRTEIKELNANLKFLKRKFNEVSEQQT